MNSRQIIRVNVTAYDGPTPAIVVVAATSGDTLAAVFDSVRRQRDLPGGPDEWAFVYEGRVQLPDTALRTLAHSLPGANETAVWLDLKRESRGDFTDILIRNNVLNGEQLLEARLLASSQGISLQEAIARKHYATPAEIAQAVEAVTPAAGAFNGVPFIDLTTIEIPRAILELVPESVARENLVLPLSLDGNVLNLVMADPNNIEAIQKLQFILNKDVRPVLATQEQILEAINRYYVPSETESVDSMLVVFTDTAIEFTKFERDRPGSVTAPPPQVTGPVPPRVAAPPAPRSAAPAPTRSTAPAPSVATPPPATRARARASASVAWAPADDELRSAVAVKRRATVRYYDRMNLQRSYPLLVILSAEEIQEIVKKAVKQAESASFQVEAGSYVEVEPILPGCNCYPPKETVPVTNEPFTATFWVVPHLLGKVRGARVVVRQDGRVLAEVPLEPRVTKQTLAVIFGMLGLVSPYLSMGLKTLKMDFESQKEQQFALYQQAGLWLLENVRPEWIGFGLLGLAVACYFWMRPHRRDVFWDITPKPVRP
ncbi:hypothetical protein [Fimbriiglobus ruber]|uniref:General secretion pathway protein E n=1 Tax=Fimbriiglobus ruber TaxID=1908690 RepID=A0A225DN33_9BACT|nr:hypothetical protein [Fimbriiglobus ruber]OWK38846.1 General secretion pathway protein E [Fimbriiglobus ruber]